MARRLLIAAPNLVPPTCPRFRNSTCCLFRGTECTTSPGQLKTFEIPCWTPLNHAENNLLLRHHRRRPVLNNKGNRNPFRRSLCQQEVGRGCGIGWPTVHGNRVIPANHHWLTILPMRIPRARSVASTHLAAALQSGCEMAANGQGSCCSQSPVHAVARSATPVC